MADDSERQIVGSATRGWLFLFIGLLLGLIPGLGVGYYWAYHDLQTWAMKLSADCMKENQYLREEVKRLQR